jgi:Tfp pilus assembly protein FimT
MIVIAVMLVVGAIALPNLTRTIYQYRLNAAASSLSSAIMATRYRAISYGCPMEMIVSNGSYQVEAYGLAQSTTGTPGSGGYAVISCSSPFATANVPNCTNNCVTPYASTQVILTAANSVTPITLQFNPSGVVSTNTTVTATAPTGPPFVIQLGLTTSSNSIKTITVSGVGNVAVR